MGAAVTFCATGRTGLGHLMRVVNIARALRHRRSDLTLDLVTNTPSADAITGDDFPFSAVKIAPRDMMAHALTGATSRAIVVDTAVIPGLDAIDAALCLVLREVPSHAVERFRPGPRRAWDLAVLPNPREAWDPGLGPAFAARTEWSGWITRSSRLGRHPAVEERARVLISCGGGGTTETTNLFRSAVAPIVSALREMGTAPPRILQIDAPRSNGIPPVPGVDGLLPPTPDLPAAFAAADLVISTAGYNSVLELAALDVPALLVPVPRTYDDQDRRASIWGPLVGCGHDRNCPDRSIIWALGTVADRQRRPPVDLGPDGAARCANLVEEILGCRAGS